MLLEICANSYESAINAQRAGAERVELCTELSVGGVTPSFGLIKQVIEALSIPVFILIRPRGGDFTYSDDEFEIMKQNIMLCKVLGCAGIVSGILHKDNTIDIERTRELVMLTKPLPFTFHRAFDWVPDPIKAIGRLKRIKVNRVLTSGLESTAEKGLQLLTKLKAKGGKKLLVIPGGGIHEDNAVVFKNKGFKEIHGSLTNVYSTMEQPKVTMYSDKHFDETKRSITSIDRIKTLLRNIQDEN